MSTVFNPSADNYIDFEPVYRCIVFGKGKIVYGGTKYLNEIANTKYIRLLLELRKARKVVEVDRSKVDSVEGMVRSCEECKDFDDPHIRLYLV